MCGETGEAGGESPVFKFPNFLYRLCGALEDTKTFKICFIGELPDLYQQSFPNWVVMLGFIIC